MKLIFLLSIVISVSIASAFLKEEIGSDLRNSNAESAARILADMTSSEISTDTVEAYLQLLENTEPMKHIADNLKVCDFAVTALEQQTGLKATSGSHPIKAILSCTKGDSIYRYHVADLTKNQLLRFRSKVQNWLQEKKPH